MTTGRSAAFGIGSRRGVLCAPKYYRVTQAVYFSMETGMSSPAMY